MCVLFQLYLYCSHYFRSHLTDATIITRITIDTTFRYSAYNRNCFVHTQLHTRMIEFLLTRCPLSLASLYTHAFSLQNVLNVEGLRSCLLKSLPWLLVCVNFHDCLSLMLVVVGLFGRCSMMACKKVVSR